MCSRSSEEAQMPGRKMSPQSLHILSNLSRRRKALQASGQFPSAPLAARRSRMLNADYITSGWRLRKRRQRRDVHTNTARDFGDADDAA